MRFFLTYSIVWYFIGGSLSTAIDLLLLYFLTDVVWLYYLMSQVLAFAVAFVFAFSFQKYVTFRFFQWSVLRQWGLFLLFQLIGLLINIVWLWLWVAVFSWYYMYVAVFLKWLVFLRNYSMNRIYTFPR